MSDLYSLSDMENISEEDVKARILARLKSTLQTREGSFANDVISAVAAEQCNLYHSIAGLLGMFYVDESSGEYIDKQAAQIGIVRKEGTRAACSITFTGEDGAVVPAGTLFSTYSGLSMSLTADAVISAGIASGTLTAEDVGVAYNISAGEIISTIKNYSGITGYTNAQATGGTDRETDAALLERYYKRLRCPPTSGNPYQYQQWAESVNGVGAARIVSKWAGAGTLKVILASQAKEPVEIDVVTAAAAYIETVRPVGPAVTVVSANAHNMAITANVTVDGTTTKTAVQAAFSASCKEYLQSLVAGAFDDTIDTDFETVDSKTYTVNYNHLVYLLLNIPGVTDYSALTAGGGTSNITIAADAVPVLTEVVVS